MINKNFLSKEALLYATTVGYSTLSLKLAMDRMSDIADKVEASLSGFANTTHTLRGLSSKFKPEARYVLDEGFDAVWFNYNKYLEGDYLKALKEANELQDEVGLLMTSLRNAIEGYNKCTKHLIGRPDCMATAASLMHDVGLLEYSSEMGEIKTFQADTARVLEAHEKIHNYLVNG